MLLNNDAGSICYLWSNATSIEDFEPRMQGFGSWSDLNEVGSGVFAWIRIRISNFSGYESGFSPRIPEQKESRESAQKGGTRLNLHVYIYTIYMYIFIMQEAADQQFPESRLSTHKHSASQTRQ